MTEYTRGERVRSIRQIKTGDTVFLRPGFGADPPVVATLDGVEADIKNGIPGVTYHVGKDREDSRWAYLDQIEHMAVPSEVAALTARGTGSSDPVERLGELVDLLKYPDTDDPEWIVKEARKLVGLD